MHLFICKNVFLSQLVAVTSIAYWTCGFALAYGKGNSFIGWHAYWASSDIEGDYMAFFFFEFVFAATAATLVSGALSERSDFIAYFIYSFIITGNVLYTCVLCSFCYPIVLKYKH